MSSDLPRRSLIQIPAAAGRRRRGWSIAALLAAAIACAPPPEYPLLQQFFSASRLRDLTALDKVATVVFEPREQGVVTEFTITNVERRQQSGREVKDVTISAPVRSLTGETAAKTFDLTLEQFDGRWKVTAVSPRPRVRP